VTTFRTGNGTAWLDLLATLSGRYRRRQVDALAAPAALREWLRDFGLEPSGAVNADDLERFRMVREAMHRAAVATVLGDRIEAADRRLLADALAADRALRLRRGADALAVVRPATASEALARLVRDALQDLAGPTRSHLRACGDDTCSGIFVDHTGRRRWCSDQRCGNRLRVQAHRARVGKPSG
jgi:predicted RNA-binding Zn ribbon-like protein